jgi:site-specific recombinase XerD
MIKASFSFKFYLYTGKTNNKGEHPLYVMFVVDRRKSELFLKVYIDPNKFDSHRQRIVNNITKADQLINNHLSEIESKINDRRLNLENEGVQITAALIKNIVSGKEAEYKLRLLDYIDRFIQEMEDKNEPTLTVRRQYKTTKVHLMAFLKQKGLTDIFLKNVNRAIIMDFEHYLLSTPHEFTFKPMNRNSAGKYLTRIRTIFISAQKKDLIKASPFFGFTIKNVKTNRVILTNDEIEVIKKASLGGNISLMKTRDCFLFQVYTGLRFSDAKKLCSTDIILDEGRLWIMGLTQKTKEPIRIPMLPYAKEIYDKYSAYREKTGLVIPIGVHQKYNTYLKDIACLCNLKKNITSHCGRHTFACMLLENGIEIKEIASLLGHATIKTTEIYARVTRQGLNNVAEKLDKIYGVK